MADWSELPPELLTLIAKSLETRFDVLRFRSVCSSWRSSFPPKLYFLPKCLPSRTNGRYKYYDIHITRNTFYLVRLSGPDQTSPACWLVNIRDDGIDLAKVGLLKPLLDSELKPLPTSFPKVLDLTNFQVIELGHQFVAQFSVYFNHPWDIRRHGYQSREKTAFLWSNTDSNDYVMFTVLGCLVYFRSGEKEWGVLENVGVDVADIISFNGKFYVIERNGRTMVVDQSLKVTFLRHVGSAASRKYLVQSAFNLLVVEMFFLPSSDSDDALTTVSSPLRDTVVSLRIFRLDEEAEKWDKMESLGDQILFLGLHHSISASASVFYWGKGNLIFYSSDEHLFVFDLDTATASPLEKCPAYSNLFWPPLEWVTSPESVICSGQVRSNSTDSVTSATPDVEYKHPDSNLTISARELRCKSPERVSSAGRDIGSKRSSPSSKCSFKFCCF